MVKKRSDSKQVESLMFTDRYFYSIGDWRVTGDIQDGYVKLQIHKDHGSRRTNWTVIGKGYVTPCWWLLRRSIRTVMNKAIVRANRLHQKDQKILFGKKMVGEALTNIELEAEALQLLDKEFAS